MTFLNPLVLFGLFAASIPLVLHLLNLRKMSTVEFSTLRFLQELQKTKVRKIKLKQIILLILRTLVILCAVLAFARPVVQDSLPFLGTSAKTSTIILIDNSYSMDASDQRGNRLRRAKAAAESIIEGMKEGDEVVVIPIGMPHDDVSRTFTRNAAVARKDLQSLSLASGTQNIEYAFEMAARTLESAQNYHREVFLITDKQSSADKTWQFDTVRTRLPQNVVVYAIPIGSANDRVEQNLIIDSVDVLTKIFQPGKVVEMDVRLMNSSASDARAVVVGLYFNGQRVGQRAVDIPANSSRTVRLAAPIQERGAVKAYVEIEGDALEQDNKRFFGFVVPDKPRIALIGSETDLQFVRLSYQGELSPVSFELYDASAISSVPFNEFDALFVASGLRKAELQRLNAYVQSGGGLIFFADPSLDAGTFSEITSGLGLASVQEQSLSEGSGGVITSLDRVHPLFSGMFKGETDSRSVVETPQIYKSWPSSGGQSLAQMSNGAFLSESRIGDGKVLYFAVSLRPDWSTFPFTGLFAALLYRAPAYLASREEIGYSSIVGQPLSLVLPGRFASGGNFKINEPNGGQTFRQAIVLPGGTSLQLGSVATYGVYTVFAADAKPVCAVAVNPPAQEGVLRFDDEDTFAGKLRTALNNRSKVVMLDSDTRVDLSLSRAKIGSELWKLFLVLALVFAISEMIVARVAKSDVIEE